MLYNINALDDSVLISRLLKKDDFVLRIIYKKNFPVINKFIKNNSGSDEESEDIFQEAMIIFYNNIRKPGFILECKIKTYIYSVSRRLWLNELKRKGNSLNNISEFESFVKFNDEEENDFEENDNKLKNMDLSLQLLGEPCKSVLTKYYIENMSMQEIAEIMNYTNKENAKNQKYKCLQRLKKIFFNQYRKM
ncbi:MAG: sigma-70 family RNA polymerase sigma factor [Bacteroidota bacterium]